MTAQHSAADLDLIRRFPERIGYLNLEQVDPAVIERAHAADVPIPQAVCTAGVEALRSGRRTGVRLEER
ncbi:hypothetical protein [Geodermatophilus ruber]|uniref:Uncharacterized protein n=1 Tax=Geodermatophilus ruber TaxID=504800 RepID=A0A1I4C7W0_9ACTN|nr:hypothetical protein [Geodermatophilus ruber]SFK76873.1 hypothetical protein SAMN04488085_103372 [Geodermatophilus ruber]